MQALLKSTQKKCKLKTTEAMTKKGRKIIPEYNAFLVHRSTGHVVNKIGKTLAGMSIKRGCQICSFVAKHLYIDTSLCQLIYEHIEHANKSRDHCHRSMVAGFRHALGSNLSDEMKLRIEQMHAIDLSPVQIMSQHKQDVRDMAMNNLPVTRDTFLLSSDVRNICRKRAEELWEKHASDPISVRMWVHENPKSVFYYEDHGLLDLNKNHQEDAPFTLGIQTEWQQQIMARFGHNSAIAIDAIFGTTQTRVRLIYILILCNYWQSFYCSSSNFMSFLS